MTFLWTLWVFIISICTFLGLVILIAGACSSLLDKIGRKTPFTHLEMLGILSAAFIPTVALATCLFYGERNQTQTCYSPTHSLELDIVHITRWRGDTILIYDQSKHPLPIPRNSDNHGNYIYAHCPVDTFRRCRDFLGPTIVNIRDNTIVSIYQDK